MKINKNLTPYIVDSEDTIINGLNKISGNKSGVVFTVNVHGVVEGILTDGDFRRWVVKQSQIDLTRSVSEIMNRQYVSIKEDDINSVQKIERLFEQQKVKFIPVVDDNKRLKAIIERAASSINIGNRTIDADSPAFLIAEIGNNHNGDVNLAKKLVDAAVIAGADCAKFQMRHLKTLYKNHGNPNDDREDLGSQYTLDLLDKFQLSVEEMYELFDYCKEKGIIPLCTPWDLDSFHALEEYGMDAYKIASADLTNHVLLREMARSGKVLICSTGMSKENEIIQAQELFNREGANYIFLHCNSTYPTPFKDVNLSYLNRLKMFSNDLVGYSGHERGINIVIAAVAMGAKVIEKHLTLDRNMEGNDHKISLLPDEFAEMVQAVREVELALGHADKRIMSQGEVINRENLAKSLIINRPLKQGQIITREMIDVKSPGNGIQPNHINEVIGLTANRDFAKGDFIYDTDLMNDFVQPRDYQIPFNWGIAVRYHDYKRILASSNPKLLEFHLSYKDLDENIDDYFDEQLDLNLVVHAPELFAGDHLLNLCSDDEDYRRHSIQELQRVINLTRKLKKYFKKADRPCIVTNMGGFTKDAPMASTERGRYYDKIAESLKELDREGVEIIAQTMPPFPWHFGGQRFQNLFMDYRDTAAFCKKNNLRICLDTSHSKLACNQFKWSFKTFVRNLYPYVAHLHIVDAAGVDGEGLQIGEGEIDFQNLFEEIRIYMPDVTFIPEIWQGHKNSGEGFWIALDRLEKVLPVAERS
ncbi:N-acetylneuraminate synthase family protein [Sporolactobacillus sp. CPB3-1]|uniref:N-acetylneuraminate synthase family protein n=1 Tax=Sporolactobacillus mangiferae TaxID=2940498 RepID=A0ABT0MBN4_9BACL|nr:N-acetylneuraminate synthase family protein [Sporolactobacillus mangiferae]MCL1632286.1 N-acetylneuraminate synthase family protein [Sporolactobacillus mangiferae]